MFKSLIARLARSHFYRLIKPFWFSDITPSSRCRSADASESRRPWTSPIRRRSFWISINTDDDVMFELFSIVIFSLRFVRHGFRQWRVDCVLLLLLLLQHIGVVLGTSRARHSTPPPPGKMNSKRKEKKQIRPTWRSHMRRRWQRRCHNVRFEFLHRFYTRTSNAYVFIRTIGFIVLNVVLHENLPIAWPPVQRVDFDIFIRSYDIYLKH